MAATIKRDSKGAHVHIDVVEGPDGTHFVPSTLTILPDAVLVWTNRTIDVQFVRIGRRVLRLSPAGEEGAVALTAPHAGDITTTASLRSDPTAGTTITVSPLKSKSSP